MRRWSYIDFIGNKPQPGFDCLVLYNAAGREFTQGVAQGVAQTLFCPIETSTNTWVLKMLYTSRRTVAYSLKALKLPGPNTLKTSASSHSCLCATKSRWKLLRSADAPTLGGVLMADVLLATFAPFCNEYVRGAAGGCHGATLRGDGGADKRLRSGEVSSQHAGAGAARAAAHTAMASAPKRARREEVPSGL